MPRVNGTPGGRQRVAPDEQAGVAAGLHVPPLQLEDEVLVRPLGAHHPGRLAGGDDDPVAHGERLGGDVDRHPAGEVLAVEERAEALGVGGGVGGTRAIRRGPTAGQAEAQAGAQEGTSVHGSIPLVGEGGVVAASESRSGVRRGTRC